VFLHVAQRPPNTQLMLHAHVCSSACVCVDACVSVCTIYTVYMQWLMLACDDCTFNVTLHLQVLELSVRPSCYTDSFCCMWSRSPSHYHIMCNAQDRGEIATCGMGNKVKIWDVRKPSSVRLKLVLNHGMFMYCRKSCNTWFHAYSWFFRLKAGGCKSYFLKARKLVGVDAPEETTHPPNPPPSAPTRQEGYQSAPF